MKFFKEKPTCFINKILPLKDSMRKMFKNRLVKTCPNESKKYDVLCFE